MSFGSHFEGDQIQGGLLGDPPTDAENFRSRGKSDQELTYAQMLIRRPQSGAAVFGIGDLCRSGLHRPAGDRLAGTLPTADFHGIGCS